MMSGIFIKILNMSISAGWLVLAAVAFRLIFKKAPKWARCIVWSLAAVRLLCPVSFKSIFSLLPSGETVPQNIMYADPPMLTSGIEFLNSAVSSAMSESLSPTPEASVNPMQIAVTVACAVWLLGVAAMLIYMASSYIYLKLKVRESVKDGDVYISDRISTPFILGIIRPKIYLPVTLSEKDKSIVISHEKAHIKMLHHIIKPASFLLLSVYWFNPLMWLGYVLFCRDIEGVCDEAVLRKAGAEERADYSEALLDCAVKTRHISACPLAFGENGVKGRIKSILNYKKPALWVIIASLIICAVIAVCFLTDPLSSEAENNSAERLDIGTYIYRGKAWAEATDAELDCAHPFINVEWKNPTAETVEVSSFFNIKYYDSGNGAFVECKNGEGPFFDLLSYEIRPFSSFTLTYLDFDKFDLSKEGLYRMYLNTTEESEYIIDITVNESGKASVELADSDSYDISYYYSRYAYYPNAEQKSQINSSVSLDLSSHRFYISLSPIASFVPVGTYEYDEAAKKLVMQTEDGSYTYVFDVEKNCIVFNEKESVCVTYSSFNDGASFSRALPPTFQGEGGSAYGSVEYDIDGDGETELCLLGYGPTSGVNSFTVCVIGENGIEANDFITCNHGGICFEESESTLYIVTEDTNGEKSRYEVAVKDSHIVLSGDNGNLFGIEE